VAFEAVRERPGGEGVVIVIAGHCRWPNSGGEFVQFPAIARPVSKKWRGTGCL